MSTGIQWCDETWNPIAAFDKATGKRGWYCAHVSPGCVNCYAESMNLWRGNGQKYRVPNAANVDIRIVPKVLSQPMRWREPRRVFVCSMTDLFLDEHTDLMIDQVFATMASCRRHTFQVLTKRPARARRYLEALSLLTPRMRTMRLAQSMYAEHPAHGLVRATLREENCAELAWPLPNVWLGTSVEDQRRANERIPLLIQAPAAIRFLSCEPLVGPIDFYGAGSRGADDGDPFAFSALTGTDGTDPSVPGIDWMIVGGESGPGARECDLAWVRDIVAQCANAEVACFVKQLGANPVDPWSDTGAFVFDREPVRPKLRDSHGGDIAEWPEDLRVREFPAVQP